MKTIKLQLSAGLLLLGPMLASTLRDHSAGIKQAREGTIDSLEMVELTCALAYASARRVTPTITEDEVANLIDIENVGDVFSACFGVTIPEARPGEAPEAGSPSN